MKQKKTISRRKKIKYKIRKKVEGTAERPRLVIFRSLKNIYMSLVDDVNHKTLLTVSTLSKDLQDELKPLKTKTEMSKMVGKTVAKKSLELNIKKVVFDRGGYLYHGIVKSAAEGAREGGLNF
ncbi:MAG: 50S ribosomal protein L18 [Ignavibacteria bacterium]|nr:50S ribosomal protein L18 [Ignavibacteria bacterium]